MGKKRPSRKMLIEIDIITGQTRLIDGYIELIESDAQTVFDKLGVDAKQFFELLLPRKLSKT